MFENKIALITGGTGSFGEAVLERFLKFNLKEIRIFSRDEKKQFDMRVKYNDPKLKFILGDVRNYSSIEKALQDVDFIFHAAALKQVPSCEFYPMEAINTNILGSENVFNAAIKCGVKKVILLSTDKAVYPINAMGMSKALAEKIMLEKARIKNTRTVFCATRYGNVMASRGSVIPLFVSQISKNKEITITDPNMTRFLMDLDESVDLVLYAFKNGDQGNIFVQKSPSSTIGDLVSVLKTIFNSNINTKLIGTRHGEKLYETLISREEIVRSSDMGKYFKIEIDDRGLNYDTFYTRGQKNISLVNDFTSHNTKVLNQSELTRVLLNLNFIKSKLKG
ncbi:MAG: UDP-glucose 4-epimerase [Candidatus Endolissoclinum sp. TMED37]|nr:MAG: UDP-glucose 4-epimerase [Candidatus Endolissoclinum sp. TMED37]|tara:strand:+ start:145 stop:1152 length:1008 start_codon:yes stop_codon:yes gene_type:complete